ncbi:hypothetical protein [Ekhidna sp.]|uniref:hypothetical protein n=1 Tax=Ekhidna sp. TaxID=2608089 RepID=UPI0032EFCC12
MKFSTIILLFTLFQAPLTVVKNNGDQIILTNVRFYQTEKLASKEEISYSYRGTVDKIKLKEIKRISFKETVQKKKGITTYRVILVKDNNDKLDVELDLVKVEGINSQGEKESMNLSSVDKISF